MRPSYLTMIVLMAWSFWQAGGFAQTAATPQPSANSPAALALLDAAQQSLSRPQGVDVRFQQTINSRPEPATIMGRSVTADPKRVYIELTYLQVKRQATLKLISDGETFYRLDSIPEEHRLRTYKLAEIQQALDALVTNEAEKVARSDVEKELQGIHGFQGLSAMLADLKKRMNFANPVSAKLDLPGKAALPVNMIEGKWTNEVLNVVAPPKIGTDTNQQDRRYLWDQKQEYFQFPRTARLYFDATTGQLYRLEMLGVLEKNGDEKTLTSLDLLSITPLTTLDAKLFQPTEAELKYKVVPTNLTEYLRNRHQQVLETLKQQQGQGAK